MVIVVGGMIGLGKTTVARMLGEYLNSEVFYESVDDNPILPLFYSSTEKEIQQKRYPFLLQLHFLNTRFKSIKKALVNRHNVLDRSIYEDLYFCKKNKDLGRISHLEYALYENLLENMLEELEELPKKSPDVMVYLKGSFDLVIQRIKRRGREYELDYKLLEYFKFIWKDYDSFILNDFSNNYKNTKIIVLDMNETDLNRKKDRENLLKNIDNVLNL